MPYTICQITITDYEGNALSDASVLVISKATGLPATIYSDSSGTTKSNPFMTTADGVASFYAEGGTYKITASKDGYIAEHDNVPIGSAQGYDVGTGDSQIPTVEHARTLVPQHNIQPVGVAVPAPTANDDETQGYSVGSMWQQTDSGGSSVFLLFICLDATEGAAVWRGIGTQ